MLLESELPDLQAILKKIKKNTNNGCWEWTYGVHSSGYPLVHFRGRQMALHRAMFFVFKGAIPFGQIVRHACDNKICGNPHHLELGTPGDNINDSCLRGDRKHFKIPRDIVEQLQNDEITPEEVAFKYGANLKYLKLVRRGVKRWK